MIAEGDRVLAILPGVPGLRWAVLCTRQPEASLTNAALAERFRWVDVMAVEDEGECDLVFLSTGHRAIVWKEDRVIRSSSAQLGPMVRA